MRRESRRTGPTRSPAVSCIHPSTMRYMGQSLVSEVVADKVDSRRSHSQLAPSRRPSPAPAPSPSHSYFLRSPASQCPGSRYRSNQGPQSAALRSVESRSTRKTEAQGRPTAESSRRWSPTTKRCGGQTSKVDDQKWEGVRRYSRRQRMVRVVSSRVRGGRKGKARTKEQKGSRFEEDGGCSGAEVESRQGRVHRGCRRWSGDEGSAGLDMDLGRKLESDRVAST
jgi:hypothetical protein